MDQEISSSPKETTLSSDILYGAVGIGCAPGLSSAFIEVSSPSSSQIEGNVSPDSGMIVKRAEQEAPRFTGGVPFYRWPEPRETFRLHYRDVPWAPVVIKADDGTITTNHMRNDVLHRDPEQGPAVHHKTPFGERLEYWVDGKLHRPHAQGPAIIDSHLLGEKIAVIEYFQDGQRHRPAADGSAFSAKDHAGRVMAEIYYEHGQMHRDPKRGPARYFRNSVREEWEYVVRGALHRDATDGPAFIDTNFEGRGVRREEYYRHGQLHRDPKKGPAVIMRNEDGLTRQAICHLCQEFSRIIWHQWFGMRRMACASWQSCAGVCRRRHLP